MQKPRYILKIEALEFPERIRKEDERERKMTLDFGWSNRARGGGREAELGEGPG